MRIRRQLQSLMVALVFLILYYSFFLGFVLDVKDNIVNVLNDHNLTTITIPEKVYNTTSHDWDTVDKQFNLTGFVDIAMTLAIVFAPIIFIFRYVFG